MYMFMCVSLPPSLSPSPLQLMVEYFPWFQLDGFEGRGGTNKEEGEEEKQNEEYKSEKEGVGREEKKLKAPELNW